jgi:hypothetical protein
MCKKCVIYSSKSIRCVRTDTSRLRCICPVLMALVSDISIYDVLSFYVKFLICPVPLLFIQFRPFPVSDMPGLIMHTVSDVVILGCGQCIGFVQNMICQGL